MEEFLFQSLRFAGGGALVGFLVLLLYGKLADREVEERKKLAEKVETLSDKLGDIDDNRLTKLEKVVERHIELDQGQRILTQLEIVTSALAKVERNIEKLLQGDATQAARLDDHDRHLGNIDHLLQRMIFENGKDGKHEK